MSGNERKTETIVRQKLEAVGIATRNGFVIEEQKSENPLIEKLLRNASKSGDGAGKPEFLISHKDNNDFLLAIECKADPQFHESSAHDRPKAYAVDGVLLYASYLSKEFNVIAVGVSGQSERDLKISAFLHPKGAAKAFPLKDASEKPVVITDIVSWEQYMRYAIYDEHLTEARKSDLNKFSRDLHDYIRDYAKITEAQKPLLVSGILLALMEKGFKVAYRNYEGAELAQKTFQAVKDIIGTARLGVNQERKKSAVVNAFRFIEYHPELQKVDRRKNESPLAHIVRDIDREVRPFTQNHYDYDVIGNFYGEFIRYTGGDAQGLGIVLTPKHITEFFADLAKLNKNSVVLDTCCGTGGFLISAMKKMTVGVGEDEKKKILENSLIGVEQEPSMFALAVSNMILRGDGKTNLYQGSCFDEEIFSAIKNKATAGFINPPYSQKGDDLHEWNFIIQLLDALQKNATGIVIVPMSIAIAPHTLRERLLKEHRLEAVMSMPEELFYPSTPVTCIMVFTAHVPHESDEEFESWFGYCKEDGFRKDKVLGRISKNDEVWKNIKKEWLSAFSNRKVVAGFSCRKKVTNEDEWTAEAYLETDYSNVSEKDFLSTVIDFASFLFKSGDHSLADQIIKNKRKIEDEFIDTKHWVWFKIGDIFDIARGKCGSAEKMLEKGGAMPYVGAKKENNGLMYKVFREDDYVTKGNCVVFIGDGQGSIGYSTYQEKDFIGSTTLSMGRNVNLNRYGALFIVTLLDKERFKYSFGRKWNGQKLKNTKIKLPVDAKGDPDWRFMEDFIKSLPYSGSI